ncbi:MAG: superoxide dismutase [Acidobacteria bacterium]|nr:superoxide dismutase [Acidobacteriota bacterium]
MGVAGAALAAACREDAGSFALEDSGSDVQLPELPYAPGALAPHISENTISFHYGKHHQGYVNKTKAAISGTEFEKASLEEIIIKTAGKSDWAALFNNAAQVFNHSFFWKSMTPGGGGEPGGRIAEEIRRSFGDYGKFAEAFTNAAATQFGSGWAWLVQDGDTLKILQTANADTPIAKGMRPLITIDVWEHAYYLDYQNRRSDYIKAYMDSLLNWDFAEQNLV